ncbi:MAG: UvrD-helicase domain-containing protein, partial [Alphaproteobacteria bacterium]|nr:UvrD-helicase domain-containing protein [Alphaproteobacteria bacterium]
VEQVWVGTFHGLAARILRRHAELVGLKPNFTILDTDDQLRLIKQLMEANGIDPKRFPPRGMLATISRWKDKGLTPDKVNPSEEAELAEGTGGDLYSQYQTRLKELNACDFGDLLLHNLTIFNDHPDVLAEYHGRITHIMVDEYQDTNVCQYLWIRLLAQKNRNLCCVGDDDQSIYGWRGAEITNMLRFEEVYPEAEVIRLEQNYRSTGHILEAASALIQNNESRLGKSLYTSIEKGEQVVVSGFWDGGSEARDIADKIESLVRRSQTEYNEVAVLVRAGYQTREFEERFIQIGLPYRVVGSKFYEPQEIRDAIAYLRVIAQPADDLAFERIINTPRRGIGTATIQTIHQLARAQAMPMLAAAEMLLTTDELKPAAKRSLTQIVNMFIQWRQDAAAMAHTDLAMKVLDESGYTAMWQAQKTPEAEGRLENLKELVSAMESFDNLEGFLEHISLVMDGDNDSREGEVTLMTLHAAKGLEFDVVFLPGWEEGIFPSQRTLDEKGGSGLEEERRLAYVGITRARRKLFISYASSRRVHGLWQSAVPSRFVGELPEENINEDIEQGMISATNARPNTDFAQLQPSAASGYGPGWARLQERRKSGFTPARPPAEGAQVIAGLSEYEVGDRVFHQKFGNGNVRSVEGDKLNIAFDKAGQKKVVASFVELVRKGG